jgi:hypothetical protein
MAQRHRIIVGSSEANIMKQRILELNESLVARLKTVGFRCHADIHAAFPDCCPVLYKSSWDEDDDTWYHGIVISVLPAETIEGTGGWSLIIRMDAERSRYYTTFPYNVIKVNLMKLDNNYSLKHQVMYWDKSPLFSSPNFPLPNPDLYQFGSRTLTTDDLKEAGLLSQ